MRNEQTTHLMPASPCWLLCHESHSSLSRVPKSSCILSCFSAGSGVLSHTVSGSIPFPITYKSALPYRCTELVKSFTSSPPFSPLRVATGVRYPLSDFRVHRTNHIQHYYPTKHAAPDRKISTTQVHANGLNTYSVRAAQLEPSFSLSTAAQSFSPTTGGLAPPMSVSTLSPPFKNTKVGICVIANCFGSLLTLLTLMVQNQTFGNCAASFRIFGTKTRHLRHHPAIKSATSTPSHALDSSRSLSKSSGVSTSCTTPGPQHSGIGAVSAGTATVARGERALGRGCRCGRAHTPPRPCVAPGARTGAAVTNAFMSQLLLSCVWCCSQHFLPSIPN